MHRRSATALYVLAVMLVAAPLACTRAPVDLLDGATWRYSVDGGKTFSPEAPLLPPERTVTVTMQTVFDVASRDGAVYLELTHGLAPWASLTVTLNDQPVAPPMAGMRYKTIPAIDAALLTEGRNVLTVSVPILHGEKTPQRFSDAAMSLAALKAEHLAFQTGPVLGYFDAQHFTVVCRTNIPAEVTLRARPVDAPGASDILVTSRKGRIHRFKVERQGVDAYTFRLVAAFGSVRRTTDWLAAPLWSAATDGMLRFVAAGDSRTYPQEWRKVALAIAAEKPELLVFVGDMVTQGRCDWQWDEQYFGPGGKLFATVPYYAVIGNHEEEAPLYPELFYTPTADGRRKNWHQQVGDVLLIGIVGHQPFEKGTDNHRWLQARLAESTAKFIFLFSHYPAWSSGSSGALNRKGQPYDRTTHRAQRVIMPLLEKYRATAFVAGHHHFYERSEPPAGVTTIITGGAGAPLRARPTEARQNNPHSKVFASRLHYCLFEVSNETCTMKAIAPDGEVFDTRTWQAREVK